MNNGCARFAVAGGIKKRSLRVFPKTVMDSLFRYKIIPKEIKTRT